MEGDKYYIDVARIFVAALPKSDFENLIEMPEEVRRFVFKAIFADNIATIRDQYVQAHMDAVHERSARHGGRDI